MKNKFANNKAAGFLLMLIMLLTFDGIASADNIYPSSYKLTEVNTGGELVVSRDEQSGKIRSFFLKHNWELESEVLYIWNGISRNKASGFTLPETNTLFMHPWSQNLLTVYKRGIKLYIALIDTNGNFSAGTELYGNWDEFSNPAVKWIGKTKDDNLLLQIGNSLFLCTVKENMINENILAHDVLNAVMLNSRGYDYAYLSGSQGSGTIYFVKDGGGTQPAARISLSEKIFMFPLGDAVGLVLAAEKLNNSLLNIIDSKKGILSNFWIDAKGSCIYLSGDKEAVMVYSVENHGENYAFGVTDVSKKENKETAYYDLPNGFIEPVAVYYIDNLFYIIFRNGLITINKAGEIRSSDFMPFGEIFEEPPEVTVIDNYVIISGIDASVSLQKKNNNLWFLSRFIRESGKIVIPAVLLIILIILLQLYRRQKRLVRAVLNLPSTGAVFVIDKVGRLLIANSSGKALLGLPNIISLRKPFQYYCTREHTKPLRELIENSMTDRHSVNQKININIEGDIKEWYCSVVPLRSFSGSFRGLLFTGVDITEELERKRLSNWAQLAHDMQTNLSTIRLNAEQLECDGVENNSDRKTKILHQVRLLMQRVRDVVTVGRSDSIDKQRHNGSDICREVREEFDEEIFPGAEFILNTQNVFVTCDKPKMTRALRNAVENALRSLEGKPGKIIISNWNEGAYTYFAIKDSGPGMDEKTKTKMLKPYYTTSKKYGGSGMGTMIMQHVADLHGGQILVNSEEGEGTEVIFKIPNYTDRR